jgi:hypothetical protein
MLELFSQRKRQFPPGFIFQLIQKSLFESYCEAKCRFMDSAKCPFFFFSWDFWIAPKSKPGDDFNASEIGRRSHTRPAHTAALASHGFNMTKRWTWSQTVIVERVARDISTLYRLQLRSRKFKNFMEVGSLLAVFWNG